MEVQQSRGREEASLCVGGLAYLIITTCRLSAGKVSAVDRLGRLVVRGEQMQGLQESIDPPSSH